MNASVDAFILPSRDEVNRLIHNFHLIFFILIAPSIQKIWDWFSKPIKRYSSLAIPENLMSDCNDFPCWHWSHLSLLSADYLGNFRVKWSMKTVHILLDRYKNWLIWWNEYVHHTFIPVPGWLSIDKISQVYFL